MKFELTNYRKQKTFSDEELLADLRKVSETNRGNVSRGYYEKLGGFSSALFRKRFGSWNEALKAAGLAPFYDNLAISADDLLHDLRKIASTFGGKITMEQYEAAGKFSAAPFIKGFGSWSKTLIAAGLEVNLVRNLSEYELFQNLEGVWLKLGRQPKRVEMMSPLSKFHFDTYVNRYGTWTKALEKFIEFVNREPTEDELNAPPEDAEPISDSELILNVKNDIADVAKAISVNPVLSTRVDEVIKHKTKRDPNLRLRWHVYNRDKFRCVACGRSPAKDIGVELHVDHIKPWSKGGETVLENLQTLCATCNLGKSNIE